MPSISSKEIALIPYATEALNHALKLQYLSWLNDETVVKPILSPVLDAPNKSLDIIEESFVRFTQDTAQGFFIKFLPENAFVGTMKLDKIDSITQSAELGIMLGEKRFWGKGIGIQSVNLLLQYAFETMKLHRVWGGTSSLNVRMQNLFLKAGFQEEGRLRHTNIVDGMYIDSMRYSLLREEWDEYQEQIKK